MQFCNLCPQYIWPAAILLSARRVHCAPRSTIQIYKYTLTIQVERGWRQIHSEHVHANCKGTCDSSGINNANFAADMSVARMCNTHRWSSGWEGWLGVKCRRPAYKFRTSLELLLRQVSWA